MLREGFYFQNVFTLIVVTVLGFRLIKRVLWFVLLRERFYHPAVFVGYFVRMIQSNI